MRNIILCLLAFVYANTFCQTPSKEESLELLWERMQVEGNAVYSYELLVPYVVINLSSLTSSLNEFNADGSYIAGLPIISEEEKFDAASEYSEHKRYMNHLLNIARLYGNNDYHSGTIPAEHHHKEEYKNLIINSLKWYFDGYAPPTGVYHQTFNYKEYTNTLAPMLDVVGLLIFDAIQSELGSDASIDSLYQDMVDYGHHIINGSPQKRGPNWSFRYPNCLRHVLFAQSTDLMDEYVQINDSSLGFDVWAVNGTDGYWPDWSLTHHGDENYWGMYGQSEFERRGFYGQLVKGTAWEYTTENVQFLEKATIEGLRWILYRGNTEISTAPKRMTYYLGRTDYIASMVIDNINMLIELYGDKMEDRAAMEELVANIDPSWRVTESDNTRTEISGHRYYWHTEYQVHRRENYSLAVRRVSQRARGPEDSSNHDIAVHLNYGNGYTSILRRGDEYRLSRLGMNYSAIPGTTVEQGLSNGAGRSASKKRGINMFSGGASDGHYGVGGFKMHLGEYDINTQKWNIINGAGALKGNFFFNNSMVCLGHDIKRIAPGSGTILTTINQLQRRTDVVYKLEDFSQVTIGLSETSSKTIKVRDKAWFWHDNVGYIIYGDNVEVLLKAERRAFNSVLYQDSDYRAALSSEDRSLGTINMLQLSIDHGVDPANDKYSYVVIPDIELEEMQNLEPDFLPYVIQNDNNLQAVMHPRDSVMEVIFYEPGTLHLNEEQSISSDKKCILLIKQKQDQLVVSAANPVHRGLTPSFVESESPTIGELYEDPINIDFNGFGITGESEGTYNLPISLPVERGYEGQTVTQTITLKPGNQLGINPVLFIKQITFGEQLFSNFNPVKLNYDVIIADSVKANIAAVPMDSNADIDYYWSENEDTLAIWVVNSNDSLRYNLFFPTPELKTYVETFDNLDADDTMLWDKTYTGNHGFVWNVTQVKEGVYLNDGPSVSFKDGKIESDMIGGGISRVSMELKNLNNPDNQSIKLAVKVNNNTIGTINNNTNDTTYSFALNNLNLPGRFRLAIDKMDGDTNEIAIDNISWETFTPSSNPGIFSVSINNQPPSEILSNPLTYVFNLSEPLTDISGVQVEAPEENQVEIYLFDDEQEIIIESKAPNGFSRIYLVKLIVETSVEDTEESAQNITIYPNPATDVVFIGGLSPEEYTYEIINVSGQLVQAGILNSSVLRLNQTMEGVYYLRIKNDNYHIVKQLVIKKDLKI